MSAVNTSELGGLLLRLREFNAERDWGQFHDPKNLAMLLASEVGELTALLRWVPNTDADALVRSDEHRAEVEAEVADVAIALLLFCDRCGIDLPRVIESKIVRNAVNYPPELSRGHARRPGR